MAGAFTAVDLSKLPAPDVVEALDFEYVLAQMLDDLRARDPEFTALTEADPAYKILEVAAYREVLLRQRVNDAARAVMLASASGADLDQIGANFRVYRLMIDPGDPQAIPPVPPTHESDEDFRHRIQLSPEGYTTAGSVGSYVFHALSASGDVKDASPVSPLPGEVTVYVLSRTDNGEASPELIAEVDAALSAEIVRPMTDNVTVLSASIVEYEIDAELYLYQGPDADVVLEAAQAALIEYVASVHAIGHDVTLSGVLGALQQPGVQRARLVGDSPVPDSEGRLVDIGEGEAPYCTTINVTVAGIENG